MLIRMHDLSEFLNNGQSNHVACAKADWLSSFVLICILVDIPFNMISIKSACLLLYGWRVRWNVHPNAKSHSIRFGLLLFLTFLTDSIEFGFLFLLVCWCKHKREMKHFKRKQQDQSFFLTKIGDRKFFSLLMSKYFILCAFFWYSPLLFYFEYINTEFKVEKYSGFSSKQAASSLPFLIEKCSNNIFPRSSIF